MNLVNLFHPALYVLQHPNLMVSTRGAKRSRGSRGSLLACLPNVLPRARRLLPKGDPAGMPEAGADLRARVREGLT